MSRFISTVLAALLVASTAHAEFSRAGAPSNTPGHYNVMDYGADGQDEVIWQSDNTAAFQAAIDAAGAAGGGIVDIPPGFYYFRDSIVVNYDGVTLRGSGRPGIGGDWADGTTLYPIRYPSESGESAFLFGHKSDSTVTFHSGMENLTVRCDQGRVGHCVWAQNVQGFFLRNVDVYANGLAAPDAKYAGVYIQSANSSANSDWKLQTTKNLIVGSNIFCPKGLGTSGAGYGLLLSATTDNAVNTSCLVQSTTFSNGRSPGRSIMVSSKCDDCGELTNAGSDGHQFINVRIDASGGSDANGDYWGGGIEFCESNRNIYIGVIDSNPALSDTAVFNQYESEDNMIIGRVDGYIYDEQPNAYTQIQVVDPSYRSGMQVRAMGFKDVGGARPSLGGGEQRPPASLFYDSTVGRLILKTSAGEDTLVVRGE